MVSLTVFGNSALSGNTFFSQGSKYLNFGVNLTDSTRIANTSRANGYGIRDNGGVMEVKNSGGLWASIATTTSTGAFPQIKFADGTVQATAGTAGFGTNQTWSNPVRSINTSYQNTTSQPIMVSYSAFGNNSAAYTYYGKYAYLAIMPRG